MNTNSNISEAPGSNGKTLWIGDLNTYADETYIARLFQDTGILF